MMFSQYEDKYVEELESDLSKLREQLAKANERVALLERVEKIFNESPELTFENVKDMFSEELNKFAIEKKAEAFNEWLYQVRFMEGLNARDLIDSATEFAKQLRKEQE